MNSLKETIFHFFVQCYVYSISKWMCGSFFAKKKIDNKNLNDTNACYHSHYQSMTISSDNIGITLNLMKISKH